MRVLYLSYDGALDPLGRSQVLPLLERLSGLGHQIELISFEKADRWRSERAVQDIQGRMAAAGVRWWPLPYHKRPAVAATAYDLRAGLRLARTRVREAQIQIVHARSYPPALIAQRIRRSLGIPFVFDMRGLYAEERVEAGIWRPNGLIFRITKWMEKGFLRDAASIITLTHASAPSLWRRIAANGGNGGLHVIPTTVDLELFQPLPLARNVGFTLAYVGSVGSWYMLDEMLSFGSVVLQEVPGSRLLYVVNEEAAAVLRAAQQAGVEESRCTVRSVAHSDVPNALKDVNATICFCTPSGSKIASAPVKVGESLAMGIPVIVNRGVGDSATLVSATGVGAVADPLDKSTFGPAIRAILSLTMDPDLSMKCRQVAEANFSVDRAAAQYSDIYKEIGR